MTHNKNSIKFRFAAIRFSIWDLHLYLDTHPDDQTAIDLLKKYYSMYDRVREEYVKAYGPFRPDRFGYSEQWLKAPWPWENCGGDD